MINLAFIINIFIKKNIINTYKKNIAFDAKNMQVKNLAKYIKKYYQNVFCQIKILKYNIK